MKKNVLFTSAICCALLASSPAFAQIDDHFVNRQSILDSQSSHKSIFFVDKNENWFIQLGAGFAFPLVEGVNSNGDHEQHLTVNYNLAFGKWFSPHFAWRASFLGGPLHYQNNGMSKFKYVSANIDFLWDILNSFDINSQRVISVIPFIGLGGSFAWDFNGPLNIYHNNHYKRNSWTLPVSGGIQIRFRLSQYIDFFTEGRAQFYGDNFNNFALGRPIDINTTVTGGFSIALDGRNFNKIEYRDYSAHIQNLNNKVNDLRAELDASNAALAEAQAQLPCPEIVKTETITIERAPLMAAVRFSINSDQISEPEKVNIYNTARWINENPDQNVEIIGYADKETGSSEFNRQLSQKRAKAVFDTLVNEFGINPKRLSIHAHGSDSQPYKTNNWNRIVIFNPK